MTTVPENTKLKRKKPSRKPRASPLGKALSRAERLLESGKVEEYRSKAKGALNAALAADIAAHSDAGLVARIERLGRLEAGYSERDPAQAALALEELAHNRDKQLHGQLPTLRIGAFALDVAAAQLKVDVYYGPDVVKKGLPFNPELVMDVITQFELELEAGSLPPERLEELLRLSWSRIRSTGRTALGESVPILDVLVEVAMLRQDPAFRKNPIREHFRSYPRWQFAYDLKRLRDARAQEGTSMRLHSSTPAQEKRGEFVWIPDGQSGSRYSHLSFQEVRS